LNHFLGGENAEAISGDLIERFNGRSRAWFWRQVLWTTAVGNLQEIRAHPQPVLKSIALGCAAFLLFVAFAGIPIRSAQSWGFESLMWMLTQANGTWRIEGADHIVAGYDKAWAFWWEPVLGLALAGWVVGRRHQNIVLLILFGAIMSFWFAIPTHVMYFTPRTVGALRLDAVFLNKTWILIPLLLALGGAFLGSVQRPTRRATTIRFGGSEGGRA
jgi:hypothetical protein